MGKFCFLVRRKEKHFFKGGALKFKQLNFFKKFQKNYSKDLCHDFSPQKFSISSSDKIKMRNED
jgi:hypothetical protein